MTSKVQTFVANLPRSTMEQYAATDPSEQFDFARDLCLNDDAPFNGQPGMDQYDAMEIALDDRALAEFDDF